MALEQTAYWCHAPVDTVLEGPMGLPVSWVQGDTTYPLRSWEQDGRIDDLNALGWKSLWQDRGDGPNRFSRFDSWGPYVVEATRVTQTGIWTDPTSEEKRSQIESEINRQVPVYSSTDTLRDRGKEADIVRSSSAATDKALELEETADDGLDTFDPTLNIAEPQESITYSRITTTIAYLEPWAARPDDDIGFLAVLDIDESSPGDGSEARILVIEGADQGAVLPFTQDTTDAQKWAVESRDGFKWSDTEQGVKLQLLWGSGSLPVSPTIALERLHDRRADFVRYGDIAAKRASK